MTWKVTADINNVNETITTRDPKAEIQRCLFKDNRANIEVYWTFGADGGQWLVGNAFYQMGKNFLDE